MAIKNIVHTTAGYFSALFIITINNLKRIIIYSFYSKTELAYFQYTEKCLLLAELHHLRFRALQIWAQSQHCSNIYKQKQKLLVY